jgi:hypothetical protein
MGKLKNPGIKHIPNGNKRVSHLILLINNLIISALRSSKKNIQNYKRLGRLLFFNCCINIKSFTHKQITMKKLLVIFAIGAFAACNGSASTEAKVDSTATVAKDSVTAVADSAKTVIDSAAAAAKDSLKTKK